MSHIESKIINILRVIADPNNPPFANLTVDQIIRTEIVPDPKNLSRPEKVQTIGEFLQTARQMAEEKGLPLIIESKDIQ